MKIEKFINFIKEKLQSDALYHEIGEFLYHVTPTKYINKILREGIVPKEGGTTSLKNTYEPRVYLATSLIASYDISIMFDSYRNIPHSIIKISSKCIDSYKIDDKFDHGIYIDYKISPNCIIDIKDSSFYFNKFDDSDLDDLY